MTIGENIRALRKEKHLTQQQLADLTNINVATVRAYEAGSYKPKLDTMYKLCKVLDCDLSDIITDSDFLNDYVQKNVFNPNRSKQVIKRIRSNKEIDENALDDLFTDITEKWNTELNSKGQKQANKMIADLFDNLSMLTKIPEYQKGNPAGNNTDNGTK